MPTERDKVAQMMLKLRKIPNSWWYKIPDVRICGSCGKLATSDKRPFDVIGSFGATSFAIEFKLKGGKVSPHQHAQLHLFARTQGVALAVEFHGAGELVRRMDEHGTFHPCENTGLAEFIEHGLY